MPEVALVCDEDRILDIYGECYGFLQPHLEPGSPGHKEAVRETIDALLGEYEMERETAVYAALYAHAGFMVILP